MQNSGNIYKHSLNGLSSVIKMLFYQILRILELLQKFRFCSSML